MADVIGYVPGAFDLFHIGHLNALRQARKWCDVLIAGVVADEICEQTKGVTPTVPLSERMEIVEAIGIVDAVYAECTPSKVDSWRDIGFHRIFKGDDWQGTPKGRRLEEEMAPLGVEVVYFPYTLQTSSTALRKALAHRGVS
ncbi:adenylyltransferase/cytidyltransferase family protein [Nocardioides sp. zg-536]|uniref:Adenylyltransferase/cytidyltransferase family protein n=1 Tax=Nocardioides faecalis TaxID=2803858 RepID=A0A939BYT9_9ACTN|nr:adenylyltransferase/cytidyltransferase family protein [Nocardioides faecalis]MBM9460315.1 adenylyltransferase/cytidyltransferase family protein [Nocardioides faecalis]MBS4751240.1 adenylyltransferase/cytidyltransferase family protein [Nocardioides faecalis]QVI59853.1 adenylyltransferase/cytidyltransferase family protein [Nocardioides faecalis]